MPNFTKHFQSFDAARVYLTVKKRTLPKGVPMSSVGFGDFRDNPDDRFASTAVGSLCRTCCSVPPIPKTRTSQMKSRRFQLLGYQITSSGHDLRIAGGAMLALKENRGLIRHFKWNTKNSASMRCVIVWILRRPPPRRLLTRSIDEAGGAIGVFKALVECELGDQLTLCS